MSIQEAPIDPEFLLSLEKLKTLGRYELIKKLGRGGAGVVFLGRDPYIKRYVAIKIARTVTDKARQRFLVEAQSAGRFNHPNIVDIHDLGVQDDFCYLTMEYIKGSTLEKYCEEGNLLPMSDVMDIVLNVCSALEYAHKEGVIHRDIKPANIMLTESNITKIADFGVAQMTESTAETGIIGTPSYMSPEQLKGETVGPESDIFSLGCVLYELLVGKKAFPGDNNFSIMYKITNEDPMPPSDIRKDIPEILAKIIGKALSKDTRNRYQNCADLALDLKVAKRGLSNTAKDEKIKDIVDYVHGLSFFQNFSVEEVEEIVSMSHIIKVKHGKFIVEQGDIDDTFYIVMSGEAKVIKDGRDLALISTGDCFGEMAMIGGQVRTANVIANNECILIKINATLLDSASEAVKFLFYKNFATTLVKRLATH